MNTTLTEWACGIVIALCIASAYHIDTPDNRSDWGASTTASEAQRQAQAEQRKRIAMAQECLRERGEGAAVIEQVDGGFRCASRRGSSRPTLIAEARP